jgi:hypothetical protein
MEVVEDDVCADKKRDNRHSIVVEADWQTSGAKYVGWSGGLEDSR